MTKPKLWTIRSEGSFRVGVPRTYVEAGDNREFEVPSMELAIRIVVCANYCAGKSTDELSAAIRSHPGRNK